MSKNLNGVLERVSESNNEYRIELRNLNNKIDEKATSIIGDVVTLSNYSLDFSNAISKVKEELVNPISRIIENYVIRDLRSVESVNEQFIEKINDKIENTKIDSVDEKEKFVNNLNNLLNDKYLQIVKIKRVDFFNEEGKNEEIQNIVNDFVSYLKQSGSFNEESIINIFNSFVNSIYELIKDSLDKISKLYLNNFVDSIKQALSDDINYEENDNYNDIDNNINETYMPDINPVSSIDIPIGSYDNNIPQVPEVEIPISNDINNDFDISSIPFAPSNMPTIEDIDNEVSPIDVSPAKLNVVKEDDTIDKPKHSYDVEEILKIAKSPVASTLDINNSLSDNDDRKDVLSSIETDLNERKLVEEMIRRLKNRLDEIDKRQNKLDDDKLKVESDESFVNDLIKNAESKKEELDEFEKSLNEKEKELVIKEQELSDKIKNVMPFANAVLNTEKGSNN